MAWEPKIVTDGLKSIATMRERSNLERQEVGRWANNRAETFHSADENARCCDFGR